MFSLRDGLVNNVCVPTCTVLKKLKLSYFLVIFRSPMDNNFRWIVFENNVCTLEIYTVKKSIRVYSVVYWTCIADCICSSIILNWNIYYARVECFTDDLCHSTVFVGQGGLKWNDRKTAFGLLGNVSLTNMPTPENGTVLFRLGSADNLLRISDHFSESLYLCSKYHPLITWLHVGETCRLPLVECRFD